MVDTKGNDIYSVDFTEFLPEALKYDPKMIALASALAEHMMAASGLIENVLIYSRIDELPEELVDILAYDLHVDWYDYSYPLKVKRDILKNSVKVHKKMGTKYAIEKALGGLFPQSEIEEWFEYGGAPHHFRIVCDVTSERIMASYQQIVNAVKMYKRLSSHMEEVTYQCRIYSTIKTHTDCYLYKNPLTGKLAAGTYPQRNRRGGQAASAFVVGTEAAGFIFTSPQAGTMPERNVVFRGTATQIDAETALNSFRYRNIPTGRTKAGETPQRSRRGQNAAGGVILEDTAEEFLFSVPVAGTVPERNTVHRTESGAITNTVEATGFLHNNKLCGSTRKL